MPSVSYCFGSLWCVSHFFHQVRASRKLSYSWLAQTKPRGVPRDFGYVKGKGVLALSVNSPHGREPEYIKQQFPPAGPKGRMTGEDKQLQAPACSAQRGPWRGRQCGLPGLGPDSVPADTGWLSVKQRVHHEEDGRGAVHQPLGLASSTPAVSGTPGMLGSQGSAGQLVGLGRRRTSKALEPLELPRDDRTGRDAAVEEEERRSVAR